MDRSSNDFPDQFTFISYFPFTTISPTASGLLLLWSIMLSFLTLLSLVRLASEVIAVSIEHVLFWSWSSSDNFRPTKNPEDAPWVGNYEVVCRCSAALFQSANEQQVSLWHTFEFELWYWDQWSVLAIRQRKSNDPLPRRPLWKFTYNLFVMGLSIPWNAPTNGTRL